MLMIIIIIINGIISKSQVNYLIMLRNKVCFVFVIMRKQKAISSYCL